MPSFTLQGWKSDADDQDDQDDDDDIISYLTSVGFDSDSEPSKNQSDLNTAQQQELILKRQRGSLKTR